jgi:quercetin dioxygenase-like cupin family protein
MPEKLKITPNESVTVQESTPEVLAVEATYAPHGSAPPKHFHPQQAEHFRVLEGQLTARVDGTERQLKAGDELDISAGAAHQMWNPGTAAARVVWETRPRGRTEQWFRAIDALHRSGRVGKNGMPGPLAFAVLLTEYRDVFRLAGPPDPIVRAVLAPLAAVGRMRGYSPRSTS